MAATFTVPSIFTAVNKVTKPVRDMERSVKMFGRSASNSMKRASISVTGFNRKISMMHSNVKRRVKGVLGSLGSLGAGIGLLAIGREVARANIEVDNSLQSLQAITGVTGESFKDFAKQIDIVSKRQKIFAGDTAKAFELVGSAKPELLESAEALAKVTEAALVLGKAGKLEVVDAVNSLTISMNQFGAGADEAAKFVDILATGQQKGSGTVKFLAEAMVNAGGTAKAFGNSFEDTVAILEGFAKSGTPASESGTMLAGILAKLSKVQKREFNPQFTKATDIIDNLAKANLSYNDLLKMTDVRGAKWLTTIINQNDVVQKLKGNLNEVGNAQEQANIQSMSFGILLKEIGAAFKNNISTTNSQNKGLNELKNVLKWVADNMDKIIATVITLIKVFALYKAITWGAVIAQRALNASIAIGKFVKFIGIIIKMARVKGIWTAAQWALNIAMTANPIGIIIVAVGALIAGIVLLVKNFSSVVDWFKSIVDWVMTSDSWFAKFIRASIYPLIIAFKIIKWVIMGVIQMFKDLVDWVKTSDSWFAKFIRYSVNVLVESFKILGIVFKEIGGFFSDIWDWIKKIGGKALQPIKDIINIFSKKTQNELGVKVVPDLKNITGITTQEMSATSKNLANQALTQEFSINEANKEVITRNDQKEVQQSNSRVDLYLNNRSKDTEIYTEGTGINVSTTGYD